MAYQQHIHSASAIRARCAVVTLSDTRDESTDTSGAKIRELLGAGHHDVVDYRLIPDEPEQLETLLQEFTGRADVDVILTNGGTGISPRDQTIDVVARNITTLLPGFGELFRMLSWEQIASGAMLSRAIGGVMSGKLIFAMPGSTKAVELAMSRLIIPELGHLLGQLRK